MKCSVCGNELEPNSTKCVVCGSVNHKGSSLTSAMSNISALANALKNKREVQEQQKAYIKDMKKVATVDEGIDELYNHDIEFVDNESDAEEFDLNTFYENAKLAKEEVKEELSQPSIEEVAEEAEESLDSAEENIVDEVDESISEEVETTKQFDEEDIVLQAEKSDILATAEENLDDLVVEDKDDNVEEVVVDQPIENPEQPQVNYDKVDKWPVLEDEPIVEEDAKKVEGDNAGVFIQFEEPSENFGYIKEDEIQTSDELQNNLEEIKIEKPDNVEPVVSEDNSEFVNLENDTTTKNTVENVKVEDFSSVKAEDVPYTQLEETAGSNVSDTHPIKIDSKDVVGASTGSNKVGTFTDEDNSKQKTKKGNKFFGVLAVIMFIATIIAFAAVMVYVHLIEGATTTNAVFDFIAEIMTGEVFMYIVLGSLGGAIVTLLFSVFQIFSRPRKMGKVMLILSLLLAIGVCVGYYFSDELLIFAWEYFKNLIGI